MKNVKRKADLLEKEFGRQDLRKIFERIDHEGDKQVVFKATQKMGSGACYINVGIDDSIYNQIQYMFASVDNEDKKKEVLTLLNELNHDYKTLKFYINRHNQIIGQVLYASDDNDFNAELYCAMFKSHFFTIQQDEYPKIMKAIWG